LVCANGKDIKVDGKSFVHWYCKAGEQGNAVDQYILGKIYQYGKGIKVNERAVH